MKTLKEVLTNKKSSLPKVEETVSLESEFLELLDEPLFEDIGDVQGHPMDPPAVLIMRRKSIRQFPNNQRVAMYYVDKINKYVTVPYTAMQWSAFGPEETEVSGDVIEESVDAIGQLQKIKDAHQIGTVNHKDGSASKVDVQTAHAILTIHKSLNIDNKKKFADMVARSKHHMQKASDFAWKHLK